MARRKTEAGKPRGAVSLDGQQIGYLIFGAFIVAGLVFTAGFVLGQRNAPEQRRPSMATYACLEVLDDLPSRAEVAKRDGELPDLRYEERLTAMAAPAAPNDRAQQVLARDRDDLALPGTAPIDEPLPTKVPGAGPLTPQAPAQAAPAPGARFTVEVKSFRGQTEAGGFANDLASRGHQAYVQPSDTDKGRFFHVYVGGFPTRSDAEQFQRGFEQNEAIDGTSVREL